jgi:chromosome segregation ATPase
MTESQLPLLQLVGALLGTGGIGAIATFLINRYKTRAEVSQSAGTSATERWKELENKQAGEVQKLREQIELLTKTISDMKEEQSKTRLELRSLAQYIMTSNQYCELLEQKLREYDPRFLEYFLGIKPKPPENLKDL